jgi:hypothetical protein
MEQLRIMQATILHMVQSAQIGCITPASEYNLLFTCLLYVYPICFSVSTWTFWRVLHARESFLHGLSTTYQSTFLGCG